MSPVKSEYELSLTIREKLAESVKIVNRRPLTVGTMYLGERLVRTEILPSSRLTNRACGHFARRENVRPCSAKDLKIVTFGRYQTNRLGSCGQLLQSVLAYATKINSPFVDI